ncbi:MBL fold metallo-hydrolase [Candidatus Fermentibacteria bacterium]|nr:MBL fold metallo-hydrolase [Candidatus Fermentibacteria bacterium]
MIRLPHRIVHLVVGELQTNCFVLLPEAKDPAVVVDPGGDGRLIAHELLRRNLRLGAVVLTHGHIDHLFGLPELLEAMGPAPILLHGDDRPLWEAMGLQAEFLGVQVPSLPNEIQEITGGQVIDEAGWSLKTMHTPGHSPGSVAFLLRGHGAVLSGDTVFHEGVGRTDLWGGSWDHLVESLRSMFALSPETVLLPGHGEFTTVGEAKRWASHSGIMTVGSAW